MAFEGRIVPNGVDALCALAGWSRRDLAERLGIGEPVLRYYERDRGPGWLTLALCGIAVCELGLSADRACELIGNGAPSHCASARAG